MMLRPFAILALAAALTTGAAPARAASAYDFSFTALEGGPLPLAQFRGKALLVVNTASLCGYTPQYAGLQSLWRRYRDRGLVVIGVPSNDFGGQEPGSAAEIKEFCETNFEIDFPLAGKESVRGEQAHAFYRWAAAELGSEKAPRWNFHKYLVDRSGRLVAGFASAVDPESDLLARAVEAALRDAP